LLKFGVLPSEEGRYEVKAFKYISSFSPDLGTQMESFPKLRKMRNTSPRFGSRFIKIPSRGIFRERKILSGQPLSYRGLPQDNGKELRMASSQGIKQASS
jgi:hypothetical protein